MTAKTIPDRIIANLHQIPPTAVGQARIRIRETYLINENGFVSVQGDDLTTYVLPQDCIVVIISVMLPMKRAVVVPVIVVFVETRQQTVTRIPVAMLHNPPKMTRHDVP